MQPARLMAAMAIAGIRPFAIHCMIADCVCSVFFSSLSSLSRQLYQTTLSTVAKSI